MIGVLLFLDVVFVGFLFLLFLLGVDLVRLLLFLGVDLVGLLFFLGRDLVGLLFFLGRDLVGLLFFLLVVVRVLLFHRIPLVCARDATSPIDAGCTTPTEPGYIACVSPGFIFVLWIDLGVLPVSRKACHLGDQGQRDLLTRRELARRALSCGGHAPRSFLLLKPPERLLGVVARGGRDRVHFLCIRARMSFWKQVVVVDVVRVSRFTRSHEAQKGIDSAHRPLVAGHTRAVAGGEGSSAASVDRLEHPEVHLLRGGVAVLLVVLVDLVAESFLDGLGDLDTAALTARAAAGVLLRPLDAL